jgi:hypothetical protein
MDDDVVVGRDAVPVVCQGRGDNYFNVAEQVLAIQRGFARSVLAATISVATIAASAAQNQAKKPTAKKAPSLDRSNQPPPAEPWAWCRLRGARVGWLRTACR